MVVYIYIYKKKNKPGLGSVLNQALDHEQDFVIVDQRNIENPETNYSKLVMFE